ncbi:MAG: glutamine-hydrolyzing carbamoyl-phosphate synthase small subunit [Phycisphaerales bacterium]
MNASPDRSSAAVPGRIVLEDGTLARGVAFGAPATTACGELVFNTAMTGYQEALTDPSYAGQVLLMTSTEIGNYGCNDGDTESGRPQVTGFVVRSLARRPSNYRATSSLSDWLAGHGVPGVAGADTRALVRRIRAAGAMRCCISTDPARSDADLLAEARSAPVMTGQNLAAPASGDRPGQWQEDLGGWWSGVAASRPSVDLPEAPLRVAAIDCGAKHTIYRHLVDRGCHVVPLAHDASADEIRAINPDGLFLSNGPGDPAAVEATIDTVRAVMHEYPTFGICLGHQLLALACGARTWKLPFGHRGANQPVRNIEHGRVEITSQNHGFCVDAESLVAADCVITHEHLNDGTVAGFRHRTEPIFSVQYHPEASPGPHDSAYLFDAFVAAMLARRAACPTSA